MAKLNQIVAIEKGIKANTLRELTDVYHQLQKTPMMSGISRTYKPKDDEGDKLPAEFTKVQVDALEVVGKIGSILSGLLDVTAKKDWTNCVAVADVVVDGKTVLAKAPVTYLLFLEKQLADLHTVFKKLPVLDAGDEWHRDDNLGCYASAVTETTRTKKVPRNHVKAEATEKHPAQVEMYHEDVLVGYWSTTKLSGALPAAKIADLVSRLEALQEAVKFAREEANAIEVIEAPTVGKSVFDYLLG
jgi:hypothetical protein